MDMGLKSFSQDRAFTQAEWHHISQHAKAPLLKLVHAGCHFVLSFSSTMKEGFFPLADWKFSCQMQGHPGLAESRRVALQVPLQSQILLIPVAATQTGETENCQLPKAVEVGGTPRVSVNTILKCWLQTRSREAFFFPSSSVFGLLRIYFIFYFYCFSLHYEGWGMGGWPQTWKEKYTKMSFKIKGTMFYWHCHQYFSCKAIKSFPASQLGGSSVHPGSQGAVSLLTATRSTGEQPHCPGPASNGSNPR